FNSTGWLTNIIDPYSQSLKIIYTNNNWVKTVTDGKGRSLTFNYTGTPQRLTSVNDSTSPSRSVSYGYSTAYNTNGDLVSFTDAEGKTSSFVCDTNHQIVATFDALNQLVVSNIFNGFGRVITQYTQG